MRKLLVGLALLGSFAFAEPMPEGSKQFQVLNAYREISAAIFFDCPPELNRPNIEVLCVGNLADAYAVMPLFDQAAIEANKLKPQQDFWQYIEGQSRWRRSYTFEDGGTLEAIFAPEDSNRLYVFYTP